MCDTFVALPDATLNGDVIFGKNSDRPFGEVQEVVVFPSQSYPPHTVLECTYIKIPQIDTTLGVILSQPSWMWGAEMGANEMGVVIGNEAVWTREPLADKGLLGMDLVRLGLERGKTAFEALQIIIDLLDKYGQGGNCAENFSFNYHNSFVIADHQEAWILETAGKYWVAEKVTKGIRSISNNLSIQDAGTIRHPDIINYAIKTGLCKKKEHFNFAKMFTEFELDEFPQGYSREGRVRELCRSNQGKFTLETAKFILRDHHANVCMHGDFISAGSQISSLSSEKNEHWFIDKPFPCRQEYKLLTFSHR